MVVFEDRSTYDEATDAVATVTLTVECNPGEVASLSNFLIGVSAKAGVYGVTLDQTVSVPEQKQGEAHGEQQVQPEHLEPEATVDGEGREADAVGEPARLDQHEDGGVAGTPGEGAEPGPGERDS